MNETTIPNWVPPSLIRVRCFLNRRGMKVKPWLGPDAILSAFYAAIREHTEDDQFWLELRQLLNDLADDMNQRITRRGWVIENELLDASAHAELLAQIRAALSTSQRDCEGLHPLVQVLPMRAGALLLMLAAAIVVGCGGEEDVPGPQSAGGASSTLANGGKTSGYVSRGGTPSDGTDLVSTSATGGTSGINIIGTIAEDPNRTRAKAACTDLGAAIELDPANFAACNPKLVAALLPYEHTDLGSTVLTCACLLNDAWQTGLGDLFADKSCEQIVEYFGECGLNKLCGGSYEKLPATFDAGALYDRCMVLLYIGVRGD